MCKKTRIRAMFNTKAWLRENKLNEVEMVTFRAIVKERLRKGSHLADAVNIYIYKVEKCQANQAA